MELSTRGAVVTGNLPGETIQYGIDAESMGHIIALLRDGLYEDKEGAVIREYFTNCIDAHIAAGTPDVQPIIKMPSKLDPVLKFRDFGKGLSLHDIKHIYSRYGTSTKRSGAAANQYVGALGLGAKCAFALQDQFTIVTYIDGLKTTYLAVLDETNKGEIKVIGSTYCGDEPNGTEIIIACERRSIDKYDSALRKYLPYFTVKPIIKGSQRNYETTVGKVIYAMPEVDTPYRNKKGEVVRSYKTSVRILERGQITPVVVMGGVMYRVDVNNGALKSALKDKGVKFNNTRFLVIDAALGAVDITPSREGLQYTHKTCSIIAETVLTLQEFLIAEAEKKSKSSTTILKAYTVTDGIRKAHNTLFSTKLQFTWRGTKVLNDYEFLQGKKVVTKGVKGTVPYYPLKSGRHAIVNAYEYRRHYANPLRRVGNRSTFDISRYSVTSTLSIRDEAATAYRKRMLLGIQEHQKANRSSTSHYYSYCFLIETEDPLKPGKYYPLTDEEVKEIQTLESLNHLGVELLSSVVLPAHLQTSTSKGSKFVRGLNPNGGKLRANVFDLLLDKPEGLDRPGDQWVGVGENKISELDGAVIVPIFRYLPDCYTAEKISDLRNFATYWKSLFGEDLRLVGVKSQYHTKYLEQFSTHAHINDIGKCFIAKLREAKLFDEAVDVLIRTSVELRAKALHNTCRSLESCDFDRSAKQLRDIQKAMLAAANNLKGSTKVESAVNYLDATLKPSLSTLLAEEKEAAYKTIIEQHVQWEKDNQVLTIILNSNARHYFQSSEAKELEKLLL